MKPLLTSILLALLILLLFAVCGCGSRKVDTVQRDSIHVENNYSQGSKIVLGNNFTYRPFDNLKPMIIEGKKYENAIVSNDKTKIVQKWKNRNITKTVTLEKTKQTEKTDYTILFLGMFFILALFLFLHIKLKNPLL